MNLLGHLYFSADDKELMIANLYGDHFHGRNYTHFPEIIQKGIYLHRQIDDFIDQSIIFESDLVEQTHNNKEKNCSNKRSSQEHGQAGLTTRRNQESERFYGKINFFLIILYLSVFNNNQNVLFFKMN